MSRQKHYHGENHLHFLTTSIYPYNAEGRVTHSSATGQWQYPTYNALGQRVEDYQSAGSSDSLKLYYPRDVFGQRTGIWDDHSSVNWVGWDVYWSHVAGQRLNMGGSSAYIDHADAVGSTVMETDPSGAVVWDITRYPWGRVWQQTGTRGSAVFAGLDWQVNDPLFPSASREYNFRVYRWMTPDPHNSGAVLSAPQSWNMYSYAGDNPITNSDPSGLYCVQGSDGSWHDEGSAGETCAEAFSDKPGSVTVTGKPGSAAAAISINALLQLSNFASTYFAPIVGRPSYMQNIPTGSGVAAKIGVGLGTALSMIGPGGDAEKGITILEGRLTKVLEAHTAGGLLSAGKSLFDNPEEVAGLIKAAESSPAVAQSGRFAGKFERIIDAGRIVGKDRAGNPTSVYTVITDSGGNLVTAFPGRP